MSRLELSGATPVASVFVVLDDRSTRTDALVRWLEGTLPRLNWRSHLFFLGQDHSPEPRRWEPLARAASRHVMACELATTYLHPLVGVDSYAPPALARLEAALAPARAYQLQAYHEQGEARLLVLPVVDAHGLAAEDVHRVTAFLRARFAEPSLLFGAGMPRDLTPGPDGIGFRAYLDPGQGDGAGAAGQLRVNHVLETLLERVQQPDADLLAPCQRHLVVDEVTGQVYPCFWAYSHDKPAASIEASTPRSEFRVPSSHCAGCMASAMTTMSDNLRANGRQREGRQVLFQLSLALAGADEHAPAAALSRQAFELSAEGADRAAALIHEGLCHKELGQLEQAEDALVQADAHTDDHAYVAFLRGQVQFVWRDYIEALERFEEALEQGSERVPVQDMLYEMALCHINIEEYADARAHLLRHEEAETSTVIRFYRGVCDHGEGAFEAARAHFEASLELGPAAEDLGRVLFYVGACLKEAERFEEAIELLLQAVDVDPDDMANHNLLGFCYYKVKRHAEAVACFERCVQIDPRSGIDWANLGSNLRDLGRTREAIAMYEKAVALDKSIGFAWDNLEKLKGNRR